MHVLILYKRIYIMEKVLYMVVPCYNEELVLEETSKRLKEKFDSLIAKDKIM